MDGAVPRPPGRVRDATIGDEHGAEVGASALADRCREPKYASEYFEADQGRLHPAGRRADLLLCPPRSCCLVVGLSAHDRLHKPRSRRR